MARQTGPSDISLSLLRAPLGSVSLQSDRALKVSADVRRDGTVPHAGTMPAGTLNPNWVELRLRKP